MKGRMSDSVKISFMALIVSIIMLFISMLQFFGFQPIIVEGTVKQLTTFGKTEQTQQPLNISNLLLAVSIFIIIIVLSVLYTNKGKIF